MSQEHSVENEAVKSVEISNPTPSTMLTADSEEENASTALDRAVQEVKTESSIRYTNISDNVDIQYILNGDSLKENIIVKSKQDVSQFRFVLKLEGLTPYTEEDGSIRLCDSETGEEKFYIPAPYMYDAEEEISYEVSYSVTELTDGSFALDIIADSAWMNAPGRAYPVVIDPAIVVSREGDNEGEDINTGYYGQNGIHHYQGTGKIYVGNASGGVGECFTYAKVSENALPTHTEKLYCGRRSVSHVPARIQRYRQSGGESLRTIC